MFNNTFPLIAINMSLGLFILGHYLRKGVEDPDQKKWQQCLAVPGIIAILLGLPIVKQWILPLAGSPLDASSVLFGILLLSLPVCMWRGWSLAPFYIYSLVAGIVGVISGAHLFLSQDESNSLVIGVAIFFGGLGGIALSQALNNRRENISRSVGAAILTIAAVFFLIAGLAGLVNGMNEGFHVTMQVPPLQ